MLPAHLLCAHLTFCVYPLLPAPQRNSSPLALVSSAPEARVLPALEQAGLSPRFDAIVTADDVYRGKPDPEGYLYAAQVRRSEMHDSPRLQAWHGLQRRTLPVGMPPACLQPRAGRPALHPPPLRPRCPACLKQKMQRPPVRCVVIGSTNLSIEAAHEVR